MTVARAPADPTAPSVSGLYAGALEGFLRRRGYVQPRRAPRDAPVARVEGHAYASTLLHGARELGDRGLGLSFGGSIGGAGFGLLGLIAATAPTLRESIAHLARLEALTSTLGRVDVQQHGTQVTLEWRPAQPVPAAVVEGILAGWVSYARYFLGAPVAPCEVQFAHARGTALADYEDLFASRVRFNAASHRLIVDAELLDAHPRYADARLNAALKGWIDHCVTAVTSAGQPYTQRVAALLGGAVPLADIDEPTVAAHLNLGLRSLQRRLRAEGTSFRRLLEAARAQHAIVALLGAAPALTDLGAAVGYAEQSSLCRAFRQWTGYAPLVFKQRQADWFTPYLPVG